MAPSSTGSGPSPIPAEPPSPTLPPGDRGVGRHWGGFLASGLLAFAADAIVLEVGVRLLALDPLIARGGAISTAMVVGWLAHRRMTFAVVESPTLAEFGKYVAAAWIAAVMNWLVFALVLHLQPDWSRLLALVVSSGAAMIISYVLMRYAVFRRI